MPVLSDPRFAIPKGSGTNGTYVLFEPYQGGTWTGPDDQTSAVQVAWDADNVYFGFVVTDDYHENSRNSPWNGDSIQLMIANATRDVQIALYNYAQGGVEDALGEVIVQHEAGPGGTEAVVARNTVTKKTIYEIKLPAASLGLTTLAAGTQFGLGMAINDGDDGPGQDGQKGWGGLGAHSIVFLKTPSETALVTLSATGPGEDRIFFSAIVPGINTFTFRANDKGAAILDPASVTLTIDGQSAALTAAPKAGDATDFTHNRSTPFPPGSDHSYTIEAKDTRGNTVTAQNTFRTPNYAALTAASRITPDTTKPGFIWNVHQADSATTLATNNRRTEDQLAGLFGNNIADPNAVGPAAGAGVPANPGTAPIQFIVPGVINFSQIEGELNGNATPDLAMPGIPGINFTDDNIAAEVLNAIEFPAAGLYRLIVNSDDAFRTTFGANPRDAFSLVAGEFNAGRGAADTLFEVFVEAPGAYAMRTIWNEGGVDANIEILSEIAGAKILLNDTATSPQALKTYQLTASGLPAYVRSVTPGIGATTIVLPRTVEAVLVDGSTTVSTTGITLKLNGVDAPVTANKTSGQTRVVHTISGDLAAGTEYTAELTYSDTAGPRTVTWKFTTGRLSSNLFVIESEDFDFDGGLTNPQRGQAGLDVNVMPYLGGAYDGLSAIEHIDFVNADGFDSDQYRTEIGDDGDHEVNITITSVGPGNGLGGTIPIQSSDRGTYTTTVNYRIGWVGGGDWQNYTRTFPANNSGGWWKVFAALSYNGTGAGQLAGNLERVTGGWGTPDQTVERLGAFSAPGSGGWGANNLVTMKNASGGDAVVKLSGTNTVRFNMSSGDFDFLIFSEATPPPPFVEAAPQDSVTRDAVVLDWTLRDTDVQVNASSIRVFVDDQDVTSSATSTKTTTGATVHLDMTGTAVAPGERRWRLTFADNNTPPQTTTAEGIFVVVPYPTPGTFVIEAEDFNYSTDGVTGGLTNPMKGTADMDVDVMPYLGGAYAGLSAVEGVDYNNNDGNDSDQYRTELDPNGENEVNITSSNGNRYSNDRGTFNVESNFRIGWVEGGSWQNYTRTFPQGTFNVWAALSYDGRAAGQLNGSLDLLTSNPAQANQTTQRLGSFTAPGSGGWGRNELVLMKNTSNAPAFVTMGGVQTVRFNLGSGDFDYLLFVPATQEAELRFTSIRKNANGSITIQWTGGGTLQSAPAVTGPWTPVAGATSPFTFTPTGNALFGRLTR